MAWQVFLYAFLMAAMAIFFMAVSLVLVAITMKLGKGKQIDTA